MKIAAIEAMWQTEPAPASFTLFGIPDPATHETHLRDQGSLGARADRDALVRTGRCRASTSWSPSAKDADRQRHRRLRRAASGCEHNPQRRRRRAPTLTSHAHDLGYALLLKRYVADPRKADDGADRARPRRHGARRGAAVLVVPRHGRASASISSPCSPSPSTARRKLDFARTWLLRLVRCGRCRCPGSPPNSAGSSPNTAASPGRSKACCRPSSPSRSVPTAQSPRSRSAASSLFYSVAARWSSFILMRRIRQARAAGKRRPDTLTARRREGANPCPFPSTTTSSRHLVGSARRAADRLRDHGRLRSRRRRLLPFVARTDSERRVVINTVGPVWEGNQVWLILGGGAIFAAWPPLYAASFSGLLPRDVPGAGGADPAAGRIQVPQQDADPRWRAFWDWALFVGGVVPSLVFGVAFGNLLQRRAVPLR